MSMVRCSECDTEKDSDFFEFECIDGKDICGECLAEMEIFKDKPDMADVVGVNHPSELGEI